METVHGKSADSIWECWEPAPSEKQFIFGPVDPIDPHLHGTVGNQITHTCDKLPSEDAGETALITSHLRDIQDRENNAQSFTSTESTPDKDTYTLNLEAPSSPHLLSSAVVTRVDGGLYDHDSADAIPSSKEGMDSVDRPSTESSQCSISDLPDHILPLGHKMSFGYSVGDVIAVGLIAWNVYKACRDAPGSFKNISQEVLSLHAVLKEVEDCLTGQPLSTSRQAHLKVVTDSCGSVLQELQALVDKYRTLDTKSKRTWDKVGFASEDIVDLRSRLTANTGLLTAYLGYVPSPVISEFQEELITPILDPMKQALVARVMEDFYAMFSSDLLPLRDLQVQKTQSSLPLVERCGSSSAGASSSPNNAKNETQTSTSDSGYYPPCGKRPLPPEDADSNDTSKRRTIRNQAGADCNNKKYACHFHQDDPQRFSCNDRTGTKYRICGGPGWKSVHRVK